MGIEDGLSALLIQNLIKTKWAGRRIEYLDAVDSTNTIAKEFGASGAEHGTLIVANTQKAGRGRLGKTWESPPEGGIYITILLRPDISPEKAPMLTLVSAMALSNAIKKVTGINSMIKWPNDIVINGKKLCGILTEMSTLENKVNYVVVGMGINVNIKKFPESIRQTASSIYIETGESTKRDLLIAQIMYSFETYYEKFMQTGDMTLLIDEYEECLASRNKRIAIISATEEYTGMSSGIDKNGALMVIKDNGEFEKVVSGEVSVRGIYGYA